MLVCRLKTSLLEYFYSNDSVVLSNCVEEVLKKDPTCCHALARLLSMHQNGMLSIILSCISRPVLTSFSFCFHAVTLLTHFIQFTSSFDLLSQCLNLDFDNQLIFSLLIINVLAYITGVLIFFSGDYSLESLLEMIALHLEATYPESSIWREFASCFLKLYEYEEDQLSVCLCGNEGEQKANPSIYYKKMPKIFTERTSRNAWMLRCKCWLKSHFARRLFGSEIASGVLLFPIMVFLHCFA